MEALMGFSFFIIAGQTGRCSTCSDNKVVFAGARWEIREQMRSVFY
jgi:hypothetical protein